MRAVSPNDWPHGFEVVADRLPRRVRGLSVGGGEQLAELYRCRPGAAAVLVDVGQVVADPNAPSVLELATLDAIVCHEAAHAVTTTTTATTEAVGKLLDATGEAVGGYDAARVARQHCPRWAAAFWLLVERACQYRRQRAATMREVVRGQLSVYGYEPAEVERVTRGADTTPAMRLLFAADGPAAALLACVLPSIETRAVAISAAGIVGVGSNKKDG